MRRPLKESEKKERRPYALKQKALGMSQKHSQSRIDVENKTDAGTATTVSEGDRQPAPLVVKKC